METVLVKDSIPFQAEGRLLQELGLRLVATPEVALVELIKNAYDADSPSCTVRLLDGKKILVVSDEGHGMTLEDFKTKWMRIATSSKTEQEVSPAFRRRLTGAKGIGRFAVRYLGDHLTLQSVSFDQSRNCKTRLTASFDWQKIDLVRDISKAKVAYSLTQLPDSATSGTILTVKRLRSSSDFTSSRELRNKVLRIVSPLQGLERGRFSTTTRRDNDDPGFSVILPGKEENEDIDLAKFIVDNFWGRLTIELKENLLRFRVTLPDFKKQRSLTIKVRSKISKGFFADIRFFPRRAGVFKNKGINGTAAWQWVRNYCGIKVVDRGFHIRPYGFEKDDWLHLDRDKSHSERDWQTEIAKNYFPLSPVQRTNPAENPVLNLPSNFQLIGAVFTETLRGLGGEDRTDLVPAMDREGLLENDAFDQLRGFVRAGIEFLANEDKALLKRREELAAKQAARTARREIAQAIEFIQASPTLTPGDKARIVTQYRDLADRVEEQEEYSSRARQSLLTMSFLGVVAGFMTHESKAIIHELEQAMTQIRRVARKIPALATTAKELSRRLENFQGYLSYSRLFVRNVRTPKQETLSAAGQIRHILNRFKSFADERGIKVENHTNQQVKTPVLPVAVYSGILLNLYTNALKAVIAARSSIAKPVVSLRAWNERGKHIVEVADNGVGIPAEMRKRIWEPLYTTTSDVGNPLGSGMGLGLTLVRQVAMEFDGSITLAEPPVGFTTCFRVVLPRKRKQ